jgi:hypothetical protein
MYHAHRRGRGGWLLDAVGGAIGLAVLARVGASGAAKVMARYVYGGGAPVGVRFVEGRYGLVPVREMHDLPEGTAVARGLDHAA